MDDAARTEADERPLVGDQELDDEWDQPAPRRPKRLGGCLPVLLVLVVLGGLLWVGGRWAFDELSTRLAEAPDYAGPGTEEVLFEVPEGASAADIGRGLREEGIVASVDAFTEAARGDERSTGIQVGFYQMRQELPAADALAILVDPENLIQSLVTVPEGARVEGIVATIVERTDLRRGALERALANPRTIGLPPEAQGNPEGFLFPATYTVPPGTSARELLAQMVAQTREVEQRLDLEARAAERGLTVEEVFTVASLLEYEANRSVDYPKVARVIYNRLEDEMPLQFDSTVTYITGRTGDVYTTARERAIDSPYNTYENAGLPAGPIGSPGEETLEAALNPADGDWLFFVPDIEAGTTRFTASYTQHLQWAEELAAYCRASEEC